MNTVSKELCKVLYELSDWEDVLLKHHESNYIEGNIGVETVYGKLVSVRDNSVGCDECEGRYLEECIPAYDLGYLMNKLQMVELDFRNAEGLFPIRLDFRPKKGWYCGLVNCQAVKGFYAETMEDAVCKLAIELFKKGVLKND